MKIISIFLLPSSPIAMNKAFESALLGTVEVLLYLSYPLTFSLSYPLSFFSSLSLLTLFFIAFSPTQICTKKSPLSSSLRRKNIHMYVRMHKHI